MTFTCKLYEVKLTGGVCKQNRKYYKHRENVINLIIRKERKKRCFSASSERFSVVVDAYE